MNALVWKSRLVTSIILGSALLAPVAPVAAAAEAKAGARILSSAMWVSFDISAVHFVPEAFYSRMQGGAPYYVVRVDIAVKNNTDRWLSLNREKSVHGDGPVEFTLRNAATGEVLAAGSYPDENGCVYGRLELPPHRMEALHYTSSVYQIDNLDTPYVVELRGRAQVNGEWRSYTLQRKVTPKDALRR